MKRPHPSECAIAVVPLDWDDVRRDDEVTYQATSQPRWEDAVFIASRKEKAANCKLLYQTLLKIDWLPATLRGAILRELGSSLREYKRELMEHQTAGYDYLIQQTEVRMRKNGEPPRGGIDDAAVEEVAKRVGKSSEALKQQLKRYKRFRQRPKVKFRRQI
jgi:hypothetical protein